MHAESGDGEAKFRLWPEGVVVSSVGFDRRKLAELVPVAHTKRDGTAGSWNEFFGS
ncbi:MAG: hypothetical protein LBU43_04135 [Candidatus Accumulibacter sp.]|nr:hypothetical protein [Accumulibacter sp.]